jgi:hypothetical protein
MTATKASDPRPESYRVDEASIRLIERSTLTDGAKVRIWQPFIATSLKQLHEDNRTTNRSLGIIRPDPGSIKFLVKPASDANAEDRDLAEQVHQMQQSSLLEDALTPLEKPEFAFSYRHTSAGKHEHIIHDWEVQEAYRQYKRRYGTDALKVCALPMLARCANRSFSVSPPQAPLRWSRRTDQPENRGSRGSLQCTLIPKRS